MNPTMTTLDQTELVKASMYYGNGAPGWVALVNEQAIEFCADPEAFHILDVTMNREYHMTY